MKTIRDFVRSKLIRAEMQDIIRFVNVGDAHDMLGSLEVRLEKTNEQVTFYTEGLIVGETALRYDALTRIAEVPGGHDMHRIALEEKDGSGIYLELSKPLADVVFATLRWIGRAQLRRRLD